jgi:hypothetical protein
MRFRSLFGDINLRVRRYAKCGRAAAGAGHRAPQRRWVSAELECVQSELAASLSYQRCAQVLRRLLPIGRGHSASTVRAQALRIGRRLDAELAASVAPSPHPSSVTAVGLDGGYVRHSASEGAQSFEIIAGRVLAKDGSQRSVGFVRSVDKHSRTRVQHAVTSVKWRLWHGRGATAIMRLESLVCLMKCSCLRRKAVIKRMSKLATELLGYLKNNADSIPDYGRRYRAGERIATSFVESAVNQIIDKRMSKSQQMRWSPEGAHLLLQVRTSVIDGRLRQDFARWYPGFAANDHEPRRAA